MIQKSWIQFCLDILMFTFKVHWTGKFLCWHLGGVFLVKCGLSLVLETRKWLFGCYLLRQCSVEAFDSIWVAVKVWYLADHLNGTLYLFQLTSIHPSISCPSGYHFQYRRKEEECLEKLQSNKLKIKLTKGVWFFSYSK